MSSYQFRDFQFRIGHDRITWAVRALILINVAVYSVQLLVNIPLGQEPVTGWLAFSPATFEHGFFWVAFTYMFVHAGLSHLFFNMLMLYFFGPDVEKILGSRQFILFYVLCGMFGVLANYISIYLLGGNPAIVVLGSSGAALGVLIAFATVAPDRRIFLFPIPIPLSARILVVIVILMNLLAARSPNSTASVATHFGGMAVAFAYIKGRPTWTQWQSRRRQSRGPTKGDLDKLGEEIDNILNFRDKDRK